MFIRFEIRRIFGVQANLDYIKQFMREMVDMIESTEIFD